MPQTWRTVRIFISSTFHDMHAERDHLVRVVFPELKERCRKRHVQLVDVDLRWGVTEEQAEGGGALDICLDEIDSCRPYFLGLLGHRYGYIPPDHEHSITAEEVYHGVLHKYLPRQIVNLRPIVEGILEGRTLLKEQVGCLVRCYQWDANKGKYLLQKDITPEDKEMLNSIFAGYSIYQRDRSFFFFRSESFTKKLARSDTKDFFETDKSLKGKLADLKQEIIDADLSYFEYDDLETFGQRVLETLWGHIDAEFPEKREEIGRDWLKEEAELHELFMVDRTRRFVGRSDILKKMHDFVEEDSEPRLMVITGEPGYGKSALMARFTEQSGYRHPDWLILSHFVGASPSSTNLRRTLRRFCAQLNRALGVAEDVPEDYRELAQLFPRLLQKVSEADHVILIIDALNQFERTDNAHAMRWLPPKLPQNVRVVVSTLPGEALDALKAWHIQPRFEQLGGLTDKEIKEFVTGYLDEICKQFPNKKIEDAFYKKIKSSSPLYIMVALEELKIFPLYEEVGKRVTSLPETILELFDQVLDRIEGDFNKQLVQDFTSLIACGRQGMSGEDLQTLLGGHATIIDKDKPPAKLPDMVFSRLLRAFTISSYLFERSGVIDFFHGQLKEAVGNRYLTEETDRDKVHQIIADNFEQRWQEPYLRALDELPHQLIKAKDWGSIKRILCDLHFIQAKCAVGMTYDLIHDYNTAFDALPEAQPEKQERLKHEAQLQKYTKDLIAYAKGEIKNLDIIPSVEPWSNERIREDTERIINNPTRLDRIRAFSQFVNSESHGLVKFAHHAGFVIQQAYNSANGGPVSTTADINACEESNAILLCHNSQWRPPYYHFPMLQRIIEWNIFKNEYNTVRSVVITSDGKKAICGVIVKYFKGELWLIDIATGERLRTIPIEEQSVDSLDVTPDCSKVISEDASDLHVWDLETGECIQTLQGHSHDVNDVRISADGKKGISASTDKTVRIWDLSTGENIKTFSGHTQKVTSVCITPDAKLALSGSADKTLRVWDVDNNKCLKVLLGHKGEISSLCMTPDGKKAVSGSQDKTVRIWDLNTGKCLKALQGHNDRLVKHISVWITPDGRRVLSGGDFDDTVRLWDIETGKCIKSFMHYGGTSSVSLTSHGKYGVTLGWYDHTLRIWELERSEGLEQLVDLGAIMSLDTTDDGKKIISGTGYGRPRVWDAENGNCIRSLKGPTRTVSSVFVTPDSTKVIFTGWDKLIWICDWKTDKCIKRIKSPTKMHSLSMTPDGKRIVSGNLDDTLRIWDIENGECIKVLEGHTSAVNQIVVTPDGKLIISASLDATSRVWNLETGDNLNILKGHMYDVRCVSVTPSGKKVVTGSMDDTLRVWDIRYTEASKILIGHVDEINCVVITPDGNTIVSGAKDNTIRVWNLNSGELIAVYQARNKVYSFSRITLKENLAYGTGDGEIIMLKIRNLLTEYLITTSVRIWLPGGIGHKGHWDDNITTLCPWCGQRFPASDKILNVIKAINRNANLSPDQSPCLELPDEAWDEPRLLSECPLCHKPLKFNPFIVDNRGRY